MPRQILAGLYAPLLGAVVAVAAAILLRTLLGTRLLPELVLEATLGIVPGEDFSTLLGVFGAYGKALLFASTILAILALYVAVWLAALRRLGTARDRLASVALAAGVAAFAALMLLSSGLVLLTDAVLLNTSWLEYTLATLLGAGLFAGVAYSQALGAAGSELDRLSIDAPAESDARRRALSMLPGLVLGGLAVTVIARTLRDTAGGGVQRSRRGQPTSPVTPVGEFYVVSKNFIDPVVDASRWTLHVGGLVSNLVDLAYDEFLAFPAEQQYTTLQCISNEVGGQLIGNAHWQGVPLNRVLERAGPLPAASHVLFRCADGYTVSIPLDFALRDQVVLAYQMNGEPLTHKHGYPVRLLAPGIYGMMHPKWITDILLMDEEVLGYWQQLGWSQEARMNTSIRIDVPAHRSAIEPGTLVIEGIAFSGDRGISRVEVSTDAGQTWADARLKPPLGPYTWVLWDYNWRRPSLAADRITVLARATDGEGVLQTPEAAPPFPDGATGYHTIEVTPA